MSSLKLAFIEILFVFDYLFIIKIINYYFKDILDRNSCKNYAL